jgi:catechol 2,3-dioxygenase-like lactoylglutathione lyase family enzyme
MSAGVSELEHVLVLCDDIDATRRFYERALGLRTGARPPLAFDGYWLYAGSVPCLHIADRAAYRTHAATLGLSVSAHVAGVGGSGSSPVDHIAFSASDYEAVTARLASAGIEPVRNDVPDGGPRQLFFSDPEGLRVEINVK